MQDRQQIDQRRRSKACAPVLNWAAAAMLCLVPAFGDAKLPRQLEGLGVDEKLGAQVDLNLQFMAEDGYPVALKSFFHKERPVVLNLVYYTCPMLCTLVLNGTTAAMREIPWTPDQEYEMVTVSIDPRDNFDIARKKKNVYLSSFGRPAPGWHFLVDYQENVKKLADQVGFRYRWDEPTQQFAHPAAVFILTPDGRVSRYLYGIKFKSRDMRLALSEASEGKLGNTVDKVLMFCFQYDPKSGSYVLFATNLMRVGGVLTVLIFGGVLIRLFRRERMSAAANSLVTAK